MLCGVWQVSTCVRTLSRRARALGSVRPNLGCWGSGFVNCDRSPGLNGNHFIRTRTRHSLMHSKFVLQRNALICWGTGDWGLWSYTHIRKHALAVLQTDAHTLARALETGCCSGCAIDCVRVLCIYNIQSAWTERARRRYNNNLMMLAAGAGKPVLQPQSQQQQPAT